MVAGAGIKKSPRAARDLPGATYVSVCSRTHYSTTRSECQPLFAENICHCFRRSRSPLGDGRGVSPPRRALTSSERSAPPPKRATFPAAASTFRRRCGEREGVERDESESPEASADAATSRRCVALLTKDGAPIRAPCRANCPPRRLSGGRWTATRSRFCATCGESGEAWRVALPLPPRRPQTPHLSPPLGRRSRPALPGRANEGAARFFYYLI